MNMNTSIEKFGGLVLTYGEDNFIYCVAYFDPVKLQLLMNLLNPRLSPEQVEQIKKLIPIMPLMCSEVTCLINVYYIKSNKMQGKYLLNMIYI